MSYKINFMEIENDRLNVNTTIIMKDGAEIVCNVPVLYPKTKDEVLLAITQREAAEIKKYDAAPVLEAIKTELEPMIGKVQTVTAVK